MKRRRNSGKWKKFIAVILVLLVALCSGLPKPMERINAATDLWKVEPSLLNNDWMVKNTYKNAGIMTFKGYRQDGGNLPVGMMLIGTYLIHKDALCAPLYTLATDSGELTNQTGEYYKSDLANGLWMDISSGNGLDDLSAKGTVVQESDLDEMWITCVVEQDGTIHYPGSSASINPFNIDDPYNLIYLSPLDPIQEAYLYFCDLKTDDRTKAQKAHILAIQCCLTNFASIKVTKKGSKDENGNVICWSGETPGSSSSELTDSFPALVPSQLFTIANNVSSLARLPLDAVCVSPSVPPSPASQLYI